jgi:hypothetical protein
LQGEKTQQQQQEAGGSNSIKKRHDRRQKRVSANAPADNLLPLVSHHLRNHYLPPAALLVDPRSYLQARGPCRRFDRLLRRRLLLLLLLEFLQLRGKLRRLLLRCVLRG